MLLLGPHDLVGRGLADGFGDRRAGHAVLRRRDAVGEALAGHGGGCWRRWDGERLRSLLRGPGRED